MGKKINTSILSTEKEEVIKLSAEDIKQRDKMCFPMRRGQSAPAREYQMSEEQEKANQVYVMNLISKGMPRSKIAADLKEHGIPHKTCYRLINRTLEELERYHEATSTQAKAVLLQLAEEKLMKLIEDGNDNMQLKYMEFIAKLKGLYQDINPVQNNNIIQFKFFGEDKNNEVSNETITLYDNSTGLQTDEAPNGCD